MSTRMVPDVEGLPYWRGHEKEGARGVPRAGRESSTGAGREKASWELELGAGGDPQSVSRSIITHDNAHQEKNSIVYY